MTVVKITVLETSIKKDLAKKVKITILKTTLDKELAAEYGIDGLTASPIMRTDDVRYAD